MVNSSLESYILIEDLFITFTTKKKKKKYIYIYIYIDDFVL